MPIANHYYSFRNNIKHKRTSNIPIHNIPILIFHLLEQIKRTALQIAN